jgi:hypothetical protein
MKKKFKIDKRIIFPRDIKRIIMLGSLGCPLSKEIQEAVRRHAAKTDERLNLEKEREAYRKLGMNPEEWDDEDIKRVKYAASITKNDQHISLEQAAKNLESLLHFDIRKVKGS